MKSQVSFKFDGVHNKSYVVAILRSGLPGFRYLVDSLNNCVFRIYVASELTSEETLEICKKVQCFAVYDKTKTLK